MKKYVSLISPTQINSNCNPQKSSKRTCSCFDTVTPLCDSTQEWNKLDGGKQARVKLKRQKGGLSFPSVKSRENI